MYRALKVIRPALLSEVIHCEQHHARAAATRQLRYWPGLAHLQASAEDGHALVRMEAAIAASYLGTREALDAMLPMLDLPMGDHLNYAVRCALGSEALSKHWQNDDALRPRINEFLKTAKRVNPIKIAKRPRDANEADFDSQQGLFTIEIGCVPERLLFTKDRFQVKPGQPVKLIFSNPDATQHNIVFVAPGALEEIGMAGNEMAKDPKAAKKGFIPKSKKILHHSKLLNQDEAEALRFLAPEEPGIYPYLCTFPGHWILMKGEMLVSE